MTNPEQQPQSILTHSVYSNSSRRIEGEDYQALADQLQPGELLYALYDLLKSEAEIEVDMAYIASLSPDDLSYGMSPSAVKSACTLVDSKEDFANKPWAVSGWVQFYAIQEAFAQMQDINRHIHI